MNSRGLTLIELMSVVGIMAIGALIVTPPLLCWKENAELRGAAAKLTTSLQLARNHALHNREYVVTEINNQNYHIFVDNGDGGGILGDWTQSGAEKILCSHKPPPGINISTTFSSGRFRFKGFGRNQPGSIVLSRSDGSSVKIVINVLGRVRTIFN